MAQHDMVLDNNPGLAFRQDLNNAIAALVSNSLGNTAPTTTYAGQFWIDTGTTISSGGPWLRQRNSANTSWNRILKMDADVWATIFTNPVFTNSLTVGGAALSAWNPDCAVVEGPLGNNLMFRKSGNTLYVSSNCYFSSAGAWIRKQSGPASIIGLSGANSYFKVYLAAAGNAGDDITSVFSNPAFYVDTLGVHSAQDATTTDGLVRLGQIPPKVNQTVISGPVDGNGYASFGGAVGSSTLTATGTIVATCGAGGTSNRIGSISSPSWTSPSGSGTGYLMLVISSTGAVTTKVHSLLPIYQHGGAYSTVNDQFTYNIQENIAKVGNGTTATQVYEVCIGECPYTSGVWSGSITWYALLGNCVTPWTNTLPGLSTKISANHNIGVIPINRLFELKCLSAESGYVAGDIVQGAATTHAAGTSPFPFNLFADNKSISTATEGGSAVIAIPKNGGNFTTLTSANWAYRFIASRGW